MLSGLIPLVVGLINRKYFTKGEKALLYLFAISPLFDLTGFILKKNGISNMLVFHIYTIIEFILISVFYSKVISNPKITLYIITIVVLFLGVAGFDLLNKLTLMDDFSTTTESIIVMLYAIFGYSLLLKNPIQSKVFAIPLFWFHTAFLLYFAGNLFVFIFSSYLQQHYKQNLFQEIWGIHSVMSMILYLLIATGFWKTKTR